MSFVIKIKHGGGDDRACRSSLGIKYFVKGVDVYHDITAVSPSDNV